MAPVYATLAQFYLYGVPAAALGTFVQPSDILALLSTGSRKADGYFRPRGYVSDDTGLASWGDDTSQAVCQYVAIDVVRLRGTNPNDPVYASAEVARTYAMDWFRDVSSGKTTPSKITMPTTSPVPFDGGPAVSTACARGW